MTELLQFLKEAKSQRNRWTAAELKRFLAGLVLAQPGLVVDWEDCDERWARVVSNGRLFSVISAEFPVCFVHESIVVSAINSTCQGLPLIRAIKDFDSPCCSTNQEEMQALFERRLSANVDYENISINDLWWVSVH